MSAIKERPILMSGPMVRAILAGKKTQARRLITPQPTGVIVGENLASTTCPVDQAKRRGCKYGKPGDRLWVRETWRTRREWDCIKPSNLPCGGHFLPEIHLDYQATIQSGLTGRWRPSIHIPRWASRITLEITDIRVERLQDISEEDAKAEGVEREFCPEDDDFHLADADERAAGYSPPKSFCAGFKNLWDLTNAKRGFGWDVNPWVWVIEFKVLGGNSNG